MGDERYRKHEQCHEDHFGSVVYIRENCPSEQQDIGDRKRPDILVDMHIARVEP